MRWGGTIRFETLNRPHLTMFVEEIVLKTEKEKVFVVDAIIDVRFGVVAPDEKKVEDRAKDVIKKLIETGILGGAGFSIEIKKISPASTP